MKTICETVNVLVAGGGTAGHVAALQAARGKRARAAVARFELLWADHLLALQDELRQGIYVPGDYTHFTIHEPKRRKISAAPFRDRVVHHAVCRVIEPPSRR